MSLSRFFLSTVTVVVDIAGVKTVPVEIGVVDIVVAFVVYIAVAMSILRQLRFVSQLIKLVSQQKISLLRFRLTSC